MTNQELKKWGFIAFVVIVVIVLLYGIFIRPSANKKISELFGMAGLSFESTNKNNTLINNSQNKGKDNKILFFYADWCGHCQQFKQEWSNFEDWAKINNVKCDALNGDKNEELTKKYNIEGYPTILKVNANGDLVTEYKGPRSSQGLQSFCTE